MGRRFIQLAESDDHPALTIRRVLRSLRSFNALRRRLFEKFSGFIALSLVLHLAGIGILIATGQAPRADAAAAARSNLRAFTRAAEGLQTDARPGRSIDPASPLARRALEEIEGQLDSLFRFERGITERDKAEFFLQLLQLIQTTAKEGPRGMPPASGPEASLEELLEASRRLDASSGAAFFITKSIVSGVFEIDKLDRPALERIERASSDSVAAEREGPPEARPVTVLSEAGPVEVPREYLYRRSPYADILARGPRLFTVFKGFARLSDDARGPSLKDPERASPGREETRSLPIGVLYLGSRMPARTSQAEKPPLSLPREERARLLDELMELKEAEQLESFRRRFLEVYDPDQGELAVLTKDFFFSNMNGVIITTDTMTTTFDLIEEIFFKRDVYDFYAEYGRRLSGTGAGIELMLHLASTYDFERRALRALCESRSDVRQALAANGLGPPAVAAYQIQAKAFVLDQLYHGVADMAGRSGLTLKDLENLYIRREEEVYRRLMDLGGEPRNRALYALGRMRWGLGDRRGAVENWKMIDVSYPVSSRALRSIRGIMDRYDIMRSPRALADVDWILAGEGAYDRSVLLERHLKFNTWSRRAD